MSDLTREIDETLFEELREIWASTKTGRMYAVITRLQSAFGRGDLSSRERLLLYGRPKEDDAYEDVVGWLAAIAPGIVVLHTEEASYLRPLSGLLERPAPESTQLFILRPFSPFSLSASLDIWPSAFPKHSRFERCPAYIYWQIGTGHGESYMRLGIEPDRWKTLNDWLDRWLPAS